MNIGLIGAGAIAQFLAEQFEHDRAFTITDALVTNKEKYAAFAARYGITLHTELEALLARPIDVVVEAATIEAVWAHVPTIVEKKPVVLISVGAFANEAFYADVLARTKQPIYLPAGAIGGLDVLQNAHALGTVQHVALTTTKPAASLTNNVITEPTVIFEGNAREAIARYPKNMNVSIMLALSVQSFEDTRVTLIADPHATQNIHAITIEGDFGEATLTIKNNPLPTNPKTSYLAAMSIIGTLKRLQSAIHIG